jgi:hypothetical protein
VPSTTTGCSQRNSADQLDGVVQPGPEKITMAGQPAVRFGGSGTMSGSPIGITAVYAFSDTTEYAVSCQHTAARAAEMERACNQVLGSFQVHGGTNNASITTVAGPTPSVTRTIKAPAPSEPSTPPANTPETIKIGQTETVTIDGTDADLTIVSVKASTCPADEYGSAPQHGYFLTVQVRATALANNSNGFDIGAIDFHAPVGGSHFETDNGNAYDAPGADNELDATLNAGESTSGTVVFDVPAKHGKIAYPPVCEGPIAYWTF